MKIDIPQCNMGGVVDAINSLHYCFNVKDYGAVGDGVTDDTQAIQNAINDAIPVNGKVIFPDPSNYYKVTDTIEISPKGDGYCWINLEGWGHRNSNIVYSGKSNTAVFKILGLKSSIISGLKVRIADNISGCVAWDIDTKDGVNSVTSVTFMNCGAILGTNGVNCVGWRYGHLSGSDGGDISHIHHINCVVYGPGANKQVKGQIGFLNEGHNTLNLTWTNSFVAYLDKAISNLSQVGTNVAGNKQAYSPQGNGSMFFYGMGGSNNNVDFEFASSGVYAIYGGRWEVGKKHMVITPASNHASVIESAVQIASYTPQDGVMWDIGRPGSYTIENVIVRNSNGSNFSSNMIKLNGFTGQGNLTVRGGAIMATDPFYTIAGGTWYITIDRVGVCNTSVQTTRYFNGRYSFINMPVARNSNGLRVGDLWADSDDNYSVKLKIN